VQPPPSRPLERRLATATPLDLRRTLAPLRRGAGDRCMRITGDTVWRASRTPDGPVTMRLGTDPAHGGVRALAWGPGAGWALDGLAALVGAEDDDAPLGPLVQAGGRANAVVRDLHRRFPGLRIPRTRAVTEALVPTILEQKVTGMEAKRSYRELVGALGSPAPGPDVGLLVPPDPMVLAALPGWAWHRFGVERKRADTVRSTCASRRRMEEATSLPPDEARRRLRALPGLGPWTAAEVARVALGDADAVSIGDYHLPDQVAWALAGRPRADDSVMLELLEPYRGQRGRVVRLIEAAGIMAPRWGPRLEVRSFRRR
jgi:3-methyladenine DNA glycosylase/8-oxoguanine DNA glycosylase